MNKATQIKNLIIGLFVVIATLLILGMVFFVEPSIGDGGQQIRVRFTNISDIGLNTRVKLNGQIVGEVTQIQVIANARETRVDIDKDKVYFYLLTLSIDSHYTVYTHDEITVKAQGVLGEKYIEITARPVPPGQALVRLNKDDIIDASSTDIFDSAFTELSDVSSKIQYLASQVSNWMDLYGDNIGETVQTFKSTLSSIDATIKEFNQLKILNDIKVTTKNMGNITYEINQMIATLHNQQFAENLSESAGSINQITQSLKSGKGTLGKLIEEKGIYLQTESILNSVRQIMQDINNYGILFHHNKVWQRKHLEALSEMSKLKNPEDFNHQMSSGIDSLQRKITQLQHITIKGENSNIVKDKDYQNKLYELQNNIQEIQNKMELYNREIFTRLNDGESK